MLLVGLFLPPRLAEFTPFFFFVIFLFQELEHAFCPISFLSSQNRFPCHFTVEPQLFHVSPRIFHFSGLELFAALFPPFLLQSFFLDRAFFAN